MGVALRVLTAIACMAGAPAAFSETHPSETFVEHVQHGLASYYARQFEGLRTTSGAVFRHASLIAAHPTYPFGTIARVTNLATGRFVDVHILDRGPSRGPQKKGVIIDLSHSAASTIGIIRAGRGRVSVEVLEWGSAR